MVSFAVLLARYLKRAGFSQSEFARRVGVGRTAVCDAVHGDKAPRWRRGDRWADVLALTDGEREEFLDAMQIAASPPRIPALVSRLEARAGKR